MDILQQVPGWVLRPLPANATTDARLLARIDKLAAGLPKTLREINAALQKIRTFAEYDTAANQAVAHVWHALDLFYEGLPADRIQLLSFAAAHMAPSAQARICRRLVKDTSFSVRAKARQIIERSNFHEVALPAKKDGDWDATGWLAGTSPGPLTRHPQGKRVLTKFGLPVVTTIGQLRELLEIKSSKQLGYFLLASDKDDGPYTTFKIPKADGSPREICAPKKQLRWVQRHILDEILAKVPTHEAAHGFVSGRSIVTNAAQHQGAELLVKFDLTDFFPTIHYFRLTGLFASLGYPVGEGRFSTDDGSRNIAPTLARLCCYTPNPASWGNAVAPQGAPTSPAISNLVCRRLDARLAGLAKRKKGVYTRYADDLTFSFKDKIDLGRLRWWVDQICHQEGFFINQKKFRVIRASQRQLVTGIVVNEELRVPREERRRFRAILHNCKTKGVKSQARGKKGFADYLRGFASYIHMVHPEEGAELLREVEEILESGTKK